MSETRDEYLSDIELEEEIEDRGVEDSGSMRVKREAVMGRRIEEAEEEGSDVSDGEDQNKETEVKRTVYVPRSKNRFDEDGVDDAELDGKKKRKSEKEKRAMLRVKAYERMAQATIREMQVAVRNDDKNNKEGKPAISKFLMMPKLFKKFTNKEFITQFLDYKGLEVIFSFIRRLPDGSLPLNKFRSEIFEFLRQFRVQGYHLEHASMLITELQNLLKGKKEAKKNKKIINRVIIKWTRVICQKVTDYTQLQYIEESEDFTRFTKEERKRKKPSSLLKKRTYSTFAHGYEEHKVYKPRRMGYQFFKRPAYSNVAIVEQDKEEYRIRRYIKDLKVRHKKKI